MKATLLVRDRIVYGEHAFAELVVLSLPRPLPGSAHGFKYRLALVVDGECVLRYDNEAGKGDHLHRDGRESGYPFTTIDALFEAFERDARRILDEDRDA